MLKIVLDTNIFISGILFGGKPRKIIESIIEGKVELYLSSGILNEIKEVLEREKFGFPEHISRQIVFEIESIGHLVRPVEKHSVVHRDDDDNVIIDCAVDAGADFIITGDDDLLSIHEFNNITIISASDFIKHVLNI